MACGVITGLPLIFNTSASHAIKTNKFYTLRYNGSFIATHHFRRDSWNFAAFLASKSLPKTFKGMCFLSLTNKTNLLVKNIII